MVELELLHEAFVGLADAAGFAELDERGLGIHVVLRHHVCDDDGCRAGFAHCTMTEICEQLKNDGRLLAVMV